METVLLHELLKSSLSVSVVGNYAKKIILSFQIYIHFSCKTLSRMGFKRGNSPSYIQIQTLEIEL